MFIGKLRDGNKKSNFMIICKFIDCARSLRLPGLFLPIYVFKRLPNLPRGSFDLGLFFSPCLSGSNDLASAPPRAKSLSRQNKTISGPKIQTSSSGSPPSTFVTETLGMTAVKSAAFTAKETASNRFPPHSRICRVVKSS